MTMAAQGPLPVRAMRRLSAETLFLGVMIASVLCAILLTVSILASVERTDAAAMDRIGASLLARLEEGGLSAVALAVEQFDTTLAPARDRFEFAIWRGQGGAWRLLRESDPGAAALLEPVPAGRRVALRDGDQRFAAAALDVAQASRGWETPVADVRISYAMRLPTEATLGARRTLGAIWAGYCFALCVGLLLHFNHRARYRAGLGHISAVLEEFSGGQTGARVAAGLPAPELVRLGDQLNEVLPRIEQLMAGLRYVSAHLAHEIRTPLQAIRSDAARLARAGDAEERRRIEASIDRTIDRADARLQNVMRLFRLQAGEKVEMRDGVDLGELVEEQVFDLQDMLEAEGRSLALSIAPGIAVRCNPQLMETLVINLLSNAAKYSPPGARIEVELTAAAGRFRLRIGNSGGGFPEALRQSAFSRFARAARHETVTGFGLGLNTVAGIAAQHGYDAEIAPPRAGEPWAEILVRGPCARATGDAPR